ncbi:MULTISPECIES: S41 family peptidase [Clostridium]|uniref:Peptidase S41 n=1 Tax=Clostridium sulfidigenes TaxID=318464 RepID=A0A084JD36_9CLOT|nr:S41 family peptidase [Clostridium sulfidigenes]KEZ86870.1 peptidase S41 [Clostridium sulfidigenes]HCO73491.1 S41 family peptidase [Clostridium sp.]
MDGKKNKWKRVTGIVALLIVTNLITLGLSNYISFKLPDGKVIVSRKTYENIVDFEKLYTIKDKLDRYYLGEIDINKLIDGAAAGMTEAVGDPYTTYMNAEEFKDFYSQTEGNYVGLGIQVGVKEDKIVVVATFENSPAEKVGILSGDIIESVNGTKVEGKDLEKAVKTMKGEKGEAVELTLSRENKGSFNVKAVRDEIEMITVKKEMIDSQVGYIQVTMFDENTSSNFENAIKDLNSKGMKSLIVDLRENPGGLLDQTVNMCSQFIPKNKNIVYTEDKNGNRKDYNSVGGIAEGLPLTILIDEGSASASEIFTGAIKDYKLGTLVGTKTFGKGVVQTTFYRDRDGFRDGTALKVTISKYYTPNGQNIHGIGIEPDILVEYPEELKGKAYDKSVDPQFEKALEVAKEKIK